MAVLKLDPEADAGDRELEFELDFLAGLTTRQRFEIMFERSRVLAEQLVRHGHRRTAQIVKRS